MLKARGKLGTLRTLRVVRVIHERGANAAATSAAGGTLKVVRLLGASVRPRFPRPPGGSYAVRQVRCMCHPRFPICELAEYIERVVSVRVNVLFVLQRGSKAAEQPTGAAEGRGAGKRKTSMPPARPTVTQTARGTQ
jgi:hypothetical protein